MRSASKVLIAAHFATTPGYSPAADSLCDLQGVSARGVSSEIMRGHNHKGFTASPSGN
jgi:hypothetical protein